MAGFTLVDLLRHGEATGGTRYRGLTDDPLSEAGWNQMRGAVADGSPWDGIVSSPLRRCREFAEALAAERGLPLELEPRFMEIGFGTWEGRTAEEIEATQPGAIPAFYADPKRGTPPGGEAFAAFRRRVAEAWNELLEHKAGRHMLVVAHGGVIRMVLALVLDLPPAGLFRIQVGHASLSRIRCDALAGALPFCQLVFHGGNGLASSRGTP